MLPLRHHEPPQHPLVEIRHADSRSVDWPVADLVLTDPPWTYSQAHGASTAGDHYDGMAAHEIAELLGRLMASRLAVWCTWPLLAEWTDATRGWAWGAPVTGGAWAKSQPGDTGHYGPGYHWAGCSELLLVYTRAGAYTNRSEALRNAWVETPREHSRKPVAWQAQMVRRWCPPGGLVLDPFSGLGSVAQAVAKAGGARRCLAVEVDAERHAASRSLLAQGAAAW